MTKIWKSLICIITISHYVYKNRILKNTYYLCKICIYCYKKIRNYFFSDVVTLRKKYIVVISNSKIIKNFPNFFTWKLNSLNIQCMILKNQFLNIFIKKIILNHETYFKTYLCPFFIGSMNLKDRLWYCTLIYLKNIWRFKLFFFSIFWLVYLIDFHLSHLDFL